MLSRRQLLKRIFAGGACLFLPKPEKQTVNEQIYLNSFHIAGYRYYNGEMIEDDMRAGDILQLIREPENVHDRRAIEIFHRQTKIGYIPRKENKVISNIMDQGYPVSVVIDGIYLDMPSWRRMTVSVYLQDFNSAVTGFAEAV